RRAAGRHNRKGRAMMHRPQRPTRGRRTTLSVGVAALASVSLVAACGGGDAGGEGGDGLTIWANTSFVGNGDTPLQEAADAFGEANDVEVTLQGVPANDLAPNLVTTVTGGSGPDAAIIDSSFIPQLAAGEVIADITDRSADLEDSFHEG